MTTGSTSEAGAPERVLPWMLVAVGLAVVAAALSVWRPTAPAIGIVETDLDQFDPAVLAAVEAYRGPRYVAVLANTILGVAVPLGVVVTRAGRRWVARLAGGRAHTPVRAGLVAFAVMVVSSAAVLPLAAWTRIVHDGRWGFRTQSAWGWLGDWLLASSGTWIAYAVGAMVLVASMRRWPASWPYRFTVFGTAVAIVGVLAHPLVIQPLFVSMTPLPDGPVREAVEEVVTAADASGVPLFVGDSSRRTTRLEAVVTGLGPTTRVVIGDNLLELSPSEVAIVVAHELAHHEHRDLERGALLAATVLLPVTLLLRRVLAAPVAARVAGARAPTDARLIAVAVAVVAVLELAGQPVVNGLSRRAEAAADARAIELTDDAASVIRTVRAFTVRDLVPPRAPGVVRVLYGTHPSVEERIRQAVALAADPAQLPDLVTLQSEEGAIAHPAVRDGPP